MNFTARAGRIHPFIWLWVIISILYLPAWRAGFVTDAIDWLHDVRSLSFSDYLNRPHSTVHSLYQLTQLTTMGIFKLFGTARLPWHLLMTTLQALNVYLLYRFFRQLFEDARIVHAARIAFWGAILACISPYLSETLVWKACFHYLQGLLLILGILICLQCYLHIPRAKWAWIAGSLFALSGFSLEIFYLTPVFTCTLIFFYYRALGWQRGSMRRTLALFFLPQVLLFGLHLALFYLRYGEWVSHSNGGGLALPLLDHAAKLAKYAFHAVLFGRFWPQGIKEKTYLFLESYGMLVFYLPAIAGIAWLAKRAIRGSTRSRAALLLLLWTLAATVLVLPMPLEQLFDMSGNRYLYITVTFHSVLLALIAGSIRGRVIIYSLGGIWVMASVFFTLRSNRHWQTATRISESLLASVPPANGRTMIMLSLPYCYKGVPMINAFPYSNFQRTHNMLMASPIREKVYDAAAFNMASPNDGSIAEMVSDSTVKVTLLQWGTWWWYKDFGGFSYETPDYKLDMRDQGHWYELTLKRPREQYLLLYQVGAEWKEVTPIP